MQPKLIFLDEPTSGLDSFSANGVVKKLVSLASHQGCSVLCTIHQPSSEVFHTFSKTLMLYKGKALYFGPIKAFSAGLRANALGCPPEYNLADHAIDLIQTTHEDKLDALRDALKMSGPADADADVPPVPTVKVVVADASGHADAPPSDGSHHGPGAHGVQAAAGFGVQLYHLSRREAQYIWRNKPALIASIVAPTFLNLLFAGIFAHVGDVNNERTKASCDSGEEVL